MSYSSDRRQSKAGEAQPAAQNNASASIVDRRASAAAQLQLKQKIDERPRGAASQLIKQLKADEELEEEAPAQLVEDEDEALQGKFEPVQRAEFEEDEEPLQGKFADSTTTPLAENLEARPNNTGLPDHLKSGVENLSGMSMDHVKVHYSSSLPAQLHAHAYAQGSDIHVAPGQERHLPHEAWHVVQQAQGRVRPTMQMKAGIAVNDDAGLESEADLMGARALQLKQPPAASTANPATQRRSQHGAANGPQLGQLKSMQAMMSSGDPIQLKLKVGATDYTALYQTPLLIDAVVDPLMLRLDAAVVGTDIEIDFGANRPAVKAQLTKWIEDDKGRPGAKSHKIFGRKEQYRIYDTDLNLAKGLLGWVLAKPGRKEEKGFADTVYTNVSIAASINSLLKKVAVKIDNLTDINGTALSKEKIGRIKRELSTDSVAGGAAYLGHYQHFFDVVSTKGAAVRTGIEKNQLKLVENPLLYSMKDKIIVLHDLMEYFMTVPWVDPNAEGRNVLPEPVADMSLSTATIDPMTGARLTTTASRGKLQVPQNTALEVSHGTRDETDAGTMLARAERAPVWAGQSFTAMRMLGLAEWVGASTAEKTALAWGIFAFWRKDYDHTVNYAYHTLHEVMDIASNFGVEYSIRNRKGGLEHHRLSSAASGLSPADEANGLKAHIDSLKDLYNQRSIAYEKDRARWFGAYEYEAMGEDDVRYQFNAADEVRSEYAEFVKLHTLILAGTDVQNNLKKAAAIASGMQTVILGLNALMTRCRVPK